MNVTEWANDVVGKPWVDRAEGPDSYDCWGLVVDSFRRIDGIEIESVDGYSSGAPIEEAGEVEQNSGRWQEVYKPIHGSIFCAYNPAGKLIHVGRIFDIKGLGVVCANARGSTNKGQVAIDGIRPIERRYSSGGVKYFTRAENGTN